VPDSKDTTMEFGSGDTATTDPSTDPAGLPGFDFQLPHPLGRYTLLERVGEGGMGVVYLAADEERDRTVAIKTLPEMSAPAMVRLKREFRTVSDLSHRNLVTLYELVNEDRVWFYAMEYVDGRDFLAHIEAQPPGDRHGELRTCLTQLVNGVDTLHEAGLLHLDLKPGNVLVDDHGRVVVLDFGLTRPPRRDSDPARGISGTPLYIAPEVLQGGDANSGSDWYALGVMMYQALAGKAPFSGNQHRFLLAKTYKDPVPPSDHRAGLPGDLEDLCMDLMRRDPDQRPGSQEILERIRTLDADRSLFSMTLYSARGPEMFIGRDEQIGELTGAFREAREGSPSIALVHGTSGIGKSALIGRCLDQLAFEYDALVLGGRCYERESVPFKAFDSLVDELAAHVQSLPEQDVAELVPPALRETARLFPALHPLSWRTPETGAEIQDPNEARRRAVEGLRTLFNRLCARGPVALWIDDLQWGDLDSAYLLIELLSGPDAPPLFVCATYRQEQAEASPMLAELREHWDRLPRPRDVELGPLSESDALRLAAFLLGDECYENRRIAAAIAAEARGLPLFVEELVRLALDQVAAGAPLERILDVLSMDSAIEARVHSVDDTARQLLELIALAGRPTAQGIVLQAAEVDGDPDALMVELRSSRLVRTTGIRDTDTVESYHDRIREGVVQMLNPSQLIHHHLQLAETIEDSGDGRPEDLARHFHGAGRLTKASQYAEVAGDRAGRAMAFEQAALFLSQALEWGSGDDAWSRGLRTRLGENLVAAGNCSAAAPVYVAAARGAEPEAAAELLCRGAEQYLASGHLAEGEAILRPLCRDYAIPYPSKPLSSLLWTLLRLAQLWLRGTRFKPRTEALVPRVDLIRADLCWSASKGLTAVDPARAGYFLLTGLLRSLRTGEEHRVARTLSSVAGAVLSPMGGMFADRARRLLAEARGIAEQADDPYLEGLTGVGMAEVHLQAGRWRQALQVSDEGETLLRERCNGVAWECNISVMCGLRALQELGDYDRFTERADAALREADERGDLYGRATASLYRAIAHIAAGELDRARDAAQTILGVWAAEDHLHIQHLYAHSILVQCDIGEGAPERGWGRIARLWPALKRSHLLRVPVVRIDAHVLRARGALALIQHAGAQRGKLIASTRADQRTLGREGRTDTDAMAALVGAALARVEGDWAEAEQQLRQAMTGFEMSDQPLHAALSKRRLGELSLDGSGEVLVVEADELMRSHGIVDPTAWADIQAPGFSG